MTAMSRTEWVWHLLPEFSEDTRARLIVQLNMRLGARHIAEEFGLPLALAQKLAYKAAGIHTFEFPSGRIDPEETVLECSAAHIRERWVDRDHSAVPLSKAGKAETKRRKGQARRADAILKSIGRPPTNSRSNGNGAIHVGFAHIVVPNYAARRSGSAAAEADRKRKEWLRENRLKLAQLQGEES